MTEWNSDEPDDIPQSNDFSRQQIRNAESSDTPPVRSFFHAAAKASWMLTLIAYAISFRFINRVEASHEIKMLFALYTFEKQHIFRQTDFVPAHVRNDPARRYGYDIPRYKTKALI